MDGQTRTRVATTAAIVGVLTVGVASVVTAVAYHGTQGEAYSPLDHWVSELGQVSVSAAAWLFNAGLVVGGLCFAAFMAGLASSVTGRLRWAWGTLGVVSGIAGAFVGIFPMDNLRPHSIAAMTFFVLGWLSVALASLDLVRLDDERFPRGVTAAFGGVVTVCFFLFMAALTNDPVTEGGRALAAPDVRPAVWAAPILEWAVVVGVLAWTLVMALAWVVAARRSRAIAHG